MYRKFISEKRRSITTPKNLVDENGRCVFGTFDKEFEEMDLLKAKKPTHAPQAMNRFKLTLWQATEVFFENGILLSAVCDMGVLGKILNVFYDKRTNKTYCFNTNLKSKDTIIAPNLLRNSIIQATTKDGFVKYVNDLGNGKCSLSGSHKNKEGLTLEYDFQLSRISKPSIVSIPFDDNRPLYSQKDFLKAEGKLIFNGEEMITDKNTVAVMDDHRGYYPRHTHYDWITTMGRNEVNGESQYFALNLTHNQSIDPEAYNENLIWFQKDISILPPVKFTKNIESKNFKEGTIWTIKDEHDMVNLQFKLSDVYGMIKHAVIVNIDYYITFGQLNGYVRDEAGNKYILDGMPVMGEDKTLLF